MSKIKLSEDNVFEVIRLLKKAYFYTRPEFSPNLDIARKSIQDALTAVTDPRSKKQKKKIAEYGPRLQAMVDGHAQYARRNSVDRVAKMQGDTELVQQLREEKFWHTHLGVE